MNITNITRLLTLILGLGFCLSFSACEEEEDPFPVNRHGIYHTYEDGLGSPHRGRDFTSPSVVKTSTSFEISGSSGSGSGINNYSLTFIIPLDATKGKHNLVGSSFELVYVQDATEYTINSGEFKIDTIETDENGDLVTLKSSFEATIEANTTSTETTFHTHTEGYVVILP
jgi:hypothetical protein